MQPIPTFRDPSIRIDFQASHWYVHFDRISIEADFFLAQPSSDLSSVIQKEALYCAIGRCAVRLKNTIPFNEWLEHTLTLEARETNPK